jgi:Tfp pilus assembly protein PilF
MLRSLLLVAALLLAGCASVAPQGPASGLFHDELFAAPSVPITGDDVLALSPAMKRYVDVDMEDRRHVKGAAKALVDALYAENELKLVYDASRTRTASQTFDARAGNCLSLAIMTAAIAKYLGVPVRFQSVISNDFWSRAGGMYFASSHVNVTLNPNVFGRYIIDERLAPVTVDFLDRDELAGQRVRVVDEPTVIAMYMNNRAAEALVAGNVDDAYWWARAAIVQDPAFRSSYNTLGVVYRQHGNLAQADEALRHALALQPGNTLVMSNLALVYDGEGRHDLARELAARVARLEPEQPFFYFNLGMTAMHNHDYAVAKAMFEKEARRDPYYHETQFWLGIACLYLGDVAEAREHLTVALENSPTRAQHALYAAKLDRLNATRVR